MSGKSSNSKQSSTTTNPNAVSVFNGAQTALGNSTYTPVTGTDINKYQSPYTGSVIDATIARNKQNQDLQMGQNAAEAMKAGAFDTTGLGVQNALTQGQYDLNNQQTAASLNDANYTQASQMASQQKAAATAYPLAIQQLLGQLAQGTQTSSTGKSSGTQFGASVGFNPKTGFSLGGG